MDKKEILIRLLKDGHISNDEFKLLYDENKVIVHEGKIEFTPIPKDIQDQIDNLRKRIDFVPIPNIAPTPWNPIDPFNPYVVTC